MSHEKVDELILSGAVEGLKKLGTKAARLHPDYEDLAADDDRKWRSYLGTAAALKKFLVPHRFEDTDSMRRALYAYGVSWNQGFVDELAGHVRGAERRRSWGPLGTANDTNLIGAPEGSPARELFAEATIDALPWVNFWHDVVLSRMLASTGGLVAVTVPKAPESMKTQADAAAAGVRPYLHFVPIQDVLNWGRDHRGFTWLKILTSDDRAADASDFHREEDLKDRIPFNVVYLELQDDGSTAFRRTDMHDEVLEEKSLGRFQAPDGHPILPVVHVRLGQHWHVDWSGRGLLDGLEELVIRAFNLNSETHEAFRDGVWSPWAYRGTDAEHVRQQLDLGSRFVDLGQDPQSQLAPAGADMTEVTAGLQLKDDLRRDWAQAAQRNIDEAVSEAAATRSGIAIAATFVMDRRPLLVAIAEALDAAEAQALYIIAQMAGATPEQSFEVDVQTDTAFRLEEVATRILRIVHDSIGAGLDIPPEMMAQAILKLAAAAPDVFGDLSEEVEGETRREVIEGQARLVLEAAMNERVNRSEILGGAGGLE